MRQPAMALDRIDKIDRIAGSDVRNLSKPVNPVNPVRRSARRISANPAALREIPSWATASQTTKRREPRPRRAATVRGGPSPRLKPDGLARRRPVAATPSGLGAVASARKPRVARTRNPNKPFVETRKRFAASLERTLSTKAVAYFPPCLPNSVASVLNAVGTRLCPRRFVFARRAAPLRARRLCAKRQKGLLK